MPSLALLLGTKACLAPYRLAASCLCDHKGTLKVLTPSLEVIYILYPKMASLPGSTVKSIKVYSKTFAAGPVEVTETRFVLLPWTECTTKCILQLGCEAMLQPLQRLSHAALCISSPWVQGAIPSRDPD